jgi:hypothetical protein
MRYAKLSLHVMPTREWTGDMPCYTSVIYRPHVFCRSDFGEQKSVVGVFGTFKWTCVFRFFGGQ